MNVIEPTKELPPIETFLESSCIGFGIDLKKVASKSRKQELVYARHAIAYFLVNSYKAKQEYIAEKLNCNRTTISSAKSMAEQNIKTNNEAFMFYYNVCKNCLYE
jgi:chromosomal replication initiation ATPase DnaA